MENQGFLNELRWRSMLQDFTPGLEEYFGSGSRRAYIGFDPTAKSLGIGNYVQIMLLTLLQRCGHQPVVVMGGATGRIGDPSGKDKERDLKTIDELEDNIQCQTNQFKKLLDFDNGPNKALLVNNFDFYSKMNALEFLRDVGKHMTVNYMLSKESVKKRLETGISYTEFSYQLLQSYDFYCLYKNLDCRIQMGGSDQWGNITAGTEYIGKTIEGSKAYAVTTPLLTKSDGKKFGKTEEGNIWLDEKMTSPYKFYQFWINSDDADLQKLFRYFSLRNKNEIEQIELQFADRPAELKKQLAEEITRRVHGDQAFASAMGVSELIFNRECTPDFLRSMDVHTLSQLYMELPNANISKSLFADSVNIIDFLSEISGILSSKSEARRSVQSNAISINKIKVTDIDARLSHNDWLSGQFILVENGKKNKYVIKIQ